MGRSYRGRDEDDFEPPGGGKPKARKSVRTAEAGAGGVYELEVVLEGSDPPVRRRLLVDADTPLDRVHRILQIAMGWSDSHLHQFVGADDVKYAAAEFELEWAEDESHYDLRDLAGRPGDIFRYEYDFGDNWAHVVRVERILGVQEAGENPVCLDGQRACPPEDCGGTEGHAELCRILADPAHRDHAAWRARLGADYDPESFDLETVNRRLAELA